MVTFQTNTSSTVKKLQNSIAFESNCRKQCLCDLLFLKWWKPRFLISERVFHWFLPNYRELAHETSHTEPYYDSTSVMVQKSPHVWKKLGGWGCGSEQAPLIISEWFILVVLDLFKVLVKCNLYILRRYPKSPFLHTYWYVLA